MIKLAPLYKILSIQLLNFHLPFSSSYVAFIAFFSCSHIFPFLNFDPSFLSCLVECSLHMSHRMKLVSFRGDLEIVGVSHDISWLITDILHVVAFFPLGLVQCGPFIIVGLFV